jgi:6,7-dimethyl-8-ribityllumazine synthase
VSGGGKPSLEAVDGTGLRVAIAASRWHDTVMAGLIDGARRALDASQVDSPTIMRAAGCFELPVLVQVLVGKEYDAVVALGVVIRGGTPHFQYVCQAVTEGLSRVVLDSRVPVGFGILTCDDEAQALDRAGLEGSREDKGFEAAHAALETALTLRRLRTRDG